ncbi:hypothetical protein CRUP_013100, partial [Coryphaenoides rupestris]
MSTHECFIIIIIIITITTLAAISCPAADRTGPQHRQNHHTSGGLSQSLSQSQSQSRQTKQQQREHLFLVWWIYCGLTDVDECQVHNGGCQHKCINTRASFYCECNPGSRLHVDARTCLRQSQEPPRPVMMTPLQDPCADQNGGCMHECRVDGGRAHCDCKVGYLLAEDSKTCTDIDECETPQANCAHGCHNTLGSYACVCLTAYELGADGKQCYSSGGVLELRPQLTLLQD